MRILHTSDWHAGRVWKGRDRLPELQSILEHVADFVERERIDLLLMTGDVYESAAPSAEAERAVTTFFKRIGMAGVPAVVIAGNHDSPLRLEAWGMLAELVNVHTRGLPRRPADGGVIGITTADGERARIAALPFASVGRLVHVLTLAQDQTAARQQYASLMQQMMAALAATFAADTVNILMAHTDVAGAVHSGSERLATLGDNWAATAQALPVSAHYIALGHLHKPQRLEAAPVPTEYAGSPMQLDFGEGGEAKTFAVIEATAGRPVRVSRVPYEGTLELGEFAGTWPELEAKAEELRRFGYLRARISIDAPDPDLNRRARRLLPNLVSVDAVEPASIDVVTPSRPPATAPPRDRFEAFYRRAHQRDPAAATLALFDELYEQASSEV
jgi:exonuclease SbcD